MTCIRTCPNLVSPRPLSWHPGRHVLLELLPYFYCLILQTPKHASCARNFNLVVRNNRARQAANQRPTSLSSFIFSLLLQFSMRALRSRWVDFACTPSVPEVVVPTDGAMACIGTDGYKPPKRKDPLRDGIARLFRVRLAAACCNRAAGICVSLPDHPLRGWPVGERPALLLS